MADNTAIEWTDATWNPIVGCSIVSKGCTNCYAMRTAGARTSHTAKYQGLTQRSKAGPVWTGEVRFWEKALTDPLKWREPRRVFVNSMGDLFHEAIPDEWIDKVFAVMALAPQRTFQVLTKRPERMRDYLTKPLTGPWAGRVTRDGHPSTDADWRVRDVVTAMLPTIDGKLLNDICARLDRHWPGDGFFRRWPLPNVWLGVSCEDQATADERIPLLLDTPAAIRFVSAEPLLGPIDFTRVRHADPKKFAWLSYAPALNALTGNYPLLEDARDLHQYRLDWIIVGGESGPNARPMNPQWARDIRDQCLAAGVAFFHKQNGEYASVSEVEGPGDHHTFPDHHTVRRVGKKAAGRLLDGREWSEFPEARP